MITVPKKGSAPVWLTDLVSGRKADPIVPHTTSSGQPRLDINETMKSFTKADDIKTNTWQNIDWMTPTKYDDAEGVNLLKSIYKHLDWENIKLGDEVTHTPIMTVSSLGNVVCAGASNCVFAYFKSPVYIRLCSPLPICICTIAAPKIWPEL